MGEVVWTVLQIKGWPADAVIHEEVRRGGRVVSRELVGIDGEAFERHAEQADELGETERAEALRAVVSELGQVVEIDGQGRYGAGNVQFEPGPPDSNGHVTGELTIGSEQNYGTEALLAVRSALRRAGFPYTVGDEWGQIGNEYEWSPGQESERKYPHTDVGRVLTEERWIGILNESGTLKEAAGRVGDFFGLPRVGESDVEIALAEQDEPPEFDGLTCERCGVQPAATCECDEAPS